MPVGYFLRNAVATLAEAAPAVPVPAVPVSPYAYTRKPSNAVLNLGGDFEPRVVSDLSQKPLEDKDLRSVGHYYSLSLDKWNMTELGTDFVYLGQHPAPFMLPNGLKAVYDAPVWAQLPESPHHFPFFADLASYDAAPKQHPVANFVGLAAEAVLAPGFMLPNVSTVVWVLHTEAALPMQALRAALFQLWVTGNRNPVILRFHLRDFPADALAQQTEAQRTMLLLGALLGPLLVDGLGDGLWLTADASLSNPGLLNEAAFGLLQASRCRMTKTEYISCPSCGRTLFDLEETTAMIRQRTDHLKGVKIGIMGCIVNGPGEMADADYGYVGSGPGKITLYRGQEVVKRNVASEQAVDELIALIAEDGKWFEREVMV
jgi:(E)-4-hydroxy-3-methylbut-2-enyl-diphosphate synthase